MHLAFTATVTPSTMRVGDGTQEQSENQIAAALPMWAVNGHFKVPTYGQVKVPTRRVLSPP